MLEETQVKRDALAVNWGDLAFSVADLIESGIIAFAGGALMVGSSYAGPLAPPLFKAALGVAAYGGLGVINSGVSIAHALKETSGLGLVERIGTHIIGEGFRKTGSTIDSVLPLGAGTFRSFMIETPKDIFDSANTLNSLENTFSEE